MEATHKHRIAGPVMLLDCPDANSVLVRVLSLSLKEEISVRRADLRVLSPVFDSSPIVHEFHIKEVHIPEIDQRFLLYLIDKSDEVVIHVQYPPHAEGLAHALFSEHGLTLPEDIRPINCGARGGTTVQRSVSGYVEFPAPDDSSLIPEGAREIKAGRLRVDSIALTLGVLKAGFEITCYTKFLKQ